MSEGLLEALRVCIDLKEGQEKVEAAFSAASASERKLFYERMLFEALLLETLKKGGGLAAARQSSARGRRFLLALRFMAVAALLVIVIGGAWIWHRSLRYAQPELTAISPTGGSTTTKALQRGEPVTVGADGATLTMGGYCRLAFDPEAEFVLRGEQRNEAIELAKGRVVCQITPERGQFSVQTPVGTVRAVGTEFAADVAYPDGKATQGALALVTVSVTSGRVEYDFGMVRGTLGAGEKQLFVQEPGAAKAGEAPKGQARRISPGGLIQWGQDLKGREKYGEAIKLYGRILREFPDWAYPGGRLIAPIAAYDIGDCYYRQKEMAKAQEAFNEALEKYPTERTGRGDLYAEMHLASILKVDAACARPGEGTSRLMQKLQTILPEEVLRKARAKVGGE